MAHQVQHVTICNITPCPVWMPGRLTNCTRLCVEWPPEPCCYFSQGQRVRGREDFYQTLCWHGERESGRWREGEREGSYQTLWWHGGREREKEGKRARGPLSQVVLTWPLQLPWGLVCLLIAVRAFLDWAPASFSNSALVALHTSWLRKLMWCKHPITLLGGIYHKPSKFQNVLVMAAILVREKSKPFKLE